MKKNYNLKLFYKLGSKWLVKRANEKEMESFLNANWDMFNERLVLYNFKKMKYWDIKFSGLNPYQLKKRFYSSVGKKMYKKNVTL